MPEYPYQITMKKFQDEGRDKTHPAEWQALQDFKQVAGKIVKTNHVLARKKSEPDGRLDVFLKTPALVRIRPDTDSNLITAIIHDKTVDPEWDGHLTEPHPQLDPDVWDVNDLTVFGDAYYVYSGQRRADTQIKRELLKPQPNTPGTLETTRPVIKLVSLTKPIAVPIPLRGDIIICTDVIAIISTPEGDKITHAAYEGQMIELQQPLDYYSDQSGCLITLKNTLPIILR